MKVLSFIIYAVFILRISAVGQSPGEIHLPSARPLKCGYVKKNKDTITSFYINPVKGVRIYACLPNDSVFSLSEGVILAVEKADDEIVCVVKSAEKVFTYSNLASSSLKKGMIIKGGDCIGKMYKDKDNRFVRITIRQKEKVLKFDEHLSFLRKAPG